MRFKLPRIRVKFIATHSIYHPISVQYFLSHYDVSLQLSQINERFYAIEVKLDISFRCYAKIYPRQLTFRLTTLSCDTGRPVLAGSRDTEVLFFNLVFITR